MSSFNSDSTFQRCCEALDRGPEQSLAPSVSKHRISRARCGLSSGAGLNASLAPVCLCAFATCINQVHNRTSQGVHPTQSDSKELIEATAVDDHCEALKGQGECTKQFPPWAQCGQAVGRQMMEQNRVTEGRGGCIINMSSVNGVTAIPSIAGYNASKGGIDNLTRCTCKRSACKKSALCSMDTICQGRVRTC